MEFTSWNPKELYHFGTRGMKWGQRRFQNPDGSLTPLGRERYGEGGQRSARGTKRDLNKLDKEYTNARVRRDDYQSYVDRKIARAKRKEARTGQKVELSNRVKKYQQKAKDYNNLMRRNKNLSDKIISKSLKKGYSIKSKDTLRVVNKGRNAAASAIATAAGIGLGLATGHYGAVGAVQFGQGKKYKVRNDGLGTRTHKSSTTVPFGKYKRR